MDEQTFEEDEQDTEVLTSAFALVRQGLYLGLIESDKKHTASYVAGLKLIA